MHYNTWSALCAALIALVAVRWVYFRILKIAKQKKLVDNPDARKLQKEPVPVMGGIAVFFGVLCGVLAGACMHAMPNLLEHVSVPNPTTNLMPILAAMSIMLYTGAIDDIVGLSPRKRLVIEVLVVMALILSSGGCIDTFRGMWGIDDITWWIAVPMTVFAGVGIINAINMIDGVNGLSSGLCLSCSILFAVAFTRIGDRSNAILAYSMAAALAPFFVHNVFGKRSRMFIGDAGTMVMGILMTWFTISTLRAPAMTSYYTENIRTNMVAMCLAILAVPVFDTLRVMTMRVLKGVSPFRADKTHLHHVFIAIGISHSVTTVTEILIDLLIVGIWGICVLLRVSLEWQLYVVIIAAVILVWGTYFFLRYHAYKKTKFLHKLTKLSFKTHMGHSRWWLRLTSLLDAPEDDAEFEENPEIHNIHLANRFGHISPEERFALDEKAILDYVRGRAEVLVKDLYIRSGVEPSRVDDVVMREIEKGALRVTKVNKEGTPEIVCLAD